MAGGDPPQGLAAGAGDWLATVFSEFMGPFNVLHQPLSLSTVAWGFWAVSAVAEAYTLVWVLDRGRSEPTSQQQGALHARPQQP